MSIEFDLEVLPPNLRKVLAPEGPAPMRQMAARGVVPGARPADLLILVTALAASSDTNLASTARTTLGKLPQPLLESALGQDLPMGIVGQLAVEFVGNQWFLERLLRQSSIDGVALSFLAERADERLGELIATNEERMLAFPVVIEKLYLNKRVRMSTAERLIELAVRHDIELSIPAFREMAAAIRNELICEPTSEPTLDDILFQQTGELAQATDITTEIEDTHEIDDEGVEHVRPRFLPLHVQIAQLTVSQKIRRATLGGSAERLLLIRDSNRLVSSAAAKSPLLKENEAICITASRNMSDEVLRIVAMNRDLLRSYQIKYNLVSNPRTPFTFVARLIPHLRESDLRNLFKSKNITGTVTQAIGQQLSRKDQRKGG
jgi:hypothetical protein